MKNIAQKTAIIYLVILAVTAVLFFLFEARAIILQLVIAIILAIALEPLVQFLMQKNLSRAWAIGFSIIGATLTILIVVGIITTPLVTEGVKLSHNTPQIIDQITNNSTFNYLNTQFGVIDKARNYTQQIPQTFSQKGLPGFGVLGTIVGGVSSFVIIIILVLFILIEGPDAWQGVMKLLPEGVAKRVNKTGIKAADVISGFVSGNLIISLIAGIVTLITLFILGIPYPFALAALVALLDLIPLIGAAIAALVIGIVALTKGVVIAIIAVAILLIYQFIEGHFIQTFIYSRSISLSPLLVIIASLTGAELGGVIGVLLAIPLSAVLQVIVVDLFSFFEDR